MKLLYGSLAVALLAVSTMPLQAGPVGRAGYDYTSVDYASPIPSSFPQSTSAVPGATSQQTVQNAVSTLNPQSAGLPGVSSSASSPTNVMQTSFYYNPYSYGVGYGSMGFYGGAVSYQRVFAVNNFGSSGPAPGSTTTSPAFNGGYNGSILSDPAANPEPGSIALLGSGIAAFLFWRRRKS